MKKTVKQTDIDYAILLTEFIQAAGPNGQQFILERLNGEAGSHLSLVDKALIFATVHHCYQERKYDGGPYISHPVSVAKKLSELGYREEVIAASVLHDVVEDTDATEQDIHDVFGHLVGGNTVCNFVQLLTDDSAGLGNRKVRKEHDANRIANSPVDVQNIKIADLIDNSTSIIEHDPDFARVYIKEKEALLDKLSPLCDERLVKEARKMIDTYRAEYPYADMKIHESKPA